MRKRNDKSFHRFQVQIQFVHNVRLYRNSSAWRATRTWPGTCFSTLDDDDAAYLPPRRLGVWPLLPKHSTCARSFSFSERLSKELVDRLDGEVAEVDANRLVLLAALCHGINRIHAILKRCRILDAHLLETNLNNLWLEGRVNLWLEGSCARCRVHHFVACACGAW
jgi:hypothetical protein